jgi:hypothetical protein
VDPWLMLALGAAVVALPVLLMRVFNGRDTADSRGRRKNRQWRAKRSRQRI